MLDDECDDVLRIKLLNALCQLGRVPSAPSTKFLAGSQDIEEFNVWLGGCLILFEAETYVGLTLTGSANIVKNVQQLIAQ